jgi:putative redox protein
MAETIISYEGGLRCRSQHPGSATVVLTDAPKDHHGQGENFSPSDLLALSLGSCILSIMAIAARSMQAEITGATATVTKQMSDAPRRITRIAVTIHVPGPFNAAQRTTLEAAARACPVHTALAIEAPIRIDWAD